MSKFSDYLESQKIDPRRILVSSKKLEALKDEDRVIRAARKATKGGTEGNDKAKELAAKKSRSGKPVNPSTLKRAMEGQPLSNGAKARLLRAVQAVAAQKKKGEVGASDLF